MKPMEPLKLRILPLDSTIQQASKQRFTHKAGSSVLMTGFDDDEVLPLPGRNSP